MSKASNLINLLESDNLYYPCVYNSFTNRINKVVGNPTTRERAELVLKQKFSREWLAAKAIPQPKEMIDKTVDVPKEFKSPEDKESQKSSSSILFKDLRVGNEVRVYIHSSKRYYEGEVTEKYPETGISLKLDDGTTHWIAINYIKKIEPRYTKNPGSMKGLI